MSPSVVRRTPLPPPPLFVCFADFSSSDHCSSQTLPHSIDLEQHLTADTKGRAASGLKAMGALLSVASFSFGGPGYSTAVIAWCPSGHRQSSHLDARDPSAAWTKRSNADLLYILVLISFDNSADGTVVSLAGGTYTRSCFGTCVAFRRFPV